METNSAASAAAGSKDTDPAVVTAVDEKDPAVAIVTLNRPAKRNALTVELKEALLTALKSVAADPGIRAVVLTGRGKSFCVGQDLGEHVQTLESDPATSFDTVEKHYNPIVRTLATMPKPVIAALNGGAVGGGAGLRTGLRPAGRGGHRDLCDGVRRDRTDRGLRALGKPRPLPRCRSGHRAAVAG